MCYAANRPANVNFSPPIRWNDVTESFLFFAHPLLAIDLALCASRVFHDEIKGQTLSSLLMLPHSIAHLVYSKVLGCTLATLPGVFALAFSIFLLQGGMRAVGELAGEPVFWWWLMNLVLLVHLTAVYSLYLRSGAFALALATMIGTMIMTAFVIAILAMGAGPDSEGVFGLVAFVLGMISASCHVIILIRMPALGER